MTTITRKIGAFHNLEFKIDLTQYGKTSSDIEDYIFSVKARKSDADNLLLLKKETTGGITASGTDIITALVSWPYDEYDNFKPGEYLAGLFIKFTGDAVADENVSQTFVLQITDDFLKDN